MPRTTITFPLDAITENLRNALAFIGLLLLAVWFLPLGEFLWYQLLVGERIHSTSILWFSWPGFAAWLYEAICFLGLGYLVHWLTLTPRPLLWAAVFGLIYSAVRLIGSQNWFAETAAWSDYVWAYGEWCVPPLAAWLGAWFAQRRVSRKSVGEIA